MLTRPAGVVKVTSVLPPRTIEHERRRLAALHEYRLLDAPADDELEAAASFRSR